MTKIGNVISDKFCQSLRGSFLKIFHAAWKFCMIFPCEVPELSLLYLKNIPACMNLTGKVFKQVRLEPS